MKSLPTISVVLASLLPLWAGSGGACPTSGSGSALERAADGLAAGEWCVFDTTNAARVSAHHNLTFDDFMTCGASGNPYFAVYFDSMRWYPGASAGNGRFYGQGGPHGGPIILTAYDEATNQWLGWGEVTPDPAQHQKGDRPCSNPKLSDPERYTGVLPCNAQHGYDQLGIDANTGHLCEVRGRGMNHAGALRCYDPAEDSWYSTAASPGVDNWQVTHGAAMDFFPERNAFVVTVGTSRVEEYNAGTKKWTRVSGFKFENNLHFATQYNPVHRVMWVMDGESRVQGHRHYRYAADGTTTELVAVDGEAKPQALGVTANIVSVDGHSGQYIVWDCDGDGRWFEYDIRTDEWRSIAHSMPPLTRHNGCSTGSVGEVSIHEYGLVGYFVEESSRQDFSFFLYRHAPAQPGEPRSAAERGQGM